MMEDKIFDEKVNVEPAAFVLRGESTINHIGDDVVEVYWSDLKDGDLEIGDFWVASGNSSVEEATVLFVDNEGCFIRFVYKNTNELTDYYEDVSLQYFDFGRG